MAGSGYSTKNWTLILILWIFGGTILSLPTILNNYPFVYFDTGFYVLTGVYGVQPWLIIWRPVIYGLIIGQFLEWFQLYAFIISQNFIVSGILLISTILSLGQWFRWWTFPCVILLSYLSPLPWTSNFILPDIFSGLIPLLCGCLFFSKSVRSRATIALITIFSATLHHSNMVTMVFLTPLFWKLVKNKRILYYTLIVIILIPWIVVPFIHGVKTQNYSISNAGHAIVFSRFMALGVAQEYLNNHCPKIDSPLCQYSHKEFDLWDWANTVYLEKSIQTEDSGIQNFKQVNSGILTSKYLFKYLRRSLEKVSDQLFASSKLLEVPTNSELIDTEMKMLTFSNYTKYKNQRLTSKSFSVLAKPLEYVFNHTTVYSFVFLVLLMVFGLLHPNIRLLFMVASGFYICNALTIGLFTEIGSRYSTRISWVFFFLFVLQLTYMVEKTRQLKLSLHR